MDLAALLDANGEIKHLTLAPTDDGWQAAILLKGAGGYWVQMGSTPSEALRAVLTPKVWVPGKPADPFEDLLG